MPSPRPRRTQRAPSLLEPQARGGENAETGFSFQESVLLARLPLWLSYDGFSAMIREAIGDTEAKFFVPGRGFVRELLEAKNHEVGTTEFWDEISRFQALDAASPGTFRWFTLASTGIASELRVLINGLRRIRSPFHFYDLDSGIIQSSSAEYRTIVTKLGKDDACARFLYEKVAIESDLAMAQTHGDTLFNSALTRHLPQFADLRPATLRGIYDGLKLFIQSRLNVPVSRQELETTIANQVPPQELPASVPVRILTAIDSDHDEGFRGLRFDWRAFWGGDARTYPPCDAWNDQLLASLRQTQAWVKASHSCRAIHLSGERRLSAMMAVGATFSAVAGFTVDVDYRGAVWSTGAYADADTPDYPLNVVLPSSSGPELVVSLGIIRRIAPEVMLALGAHSLGGAPVLELQGEQPICSDKQANKIAGVIKDSIADTLTRTGATRIHLFYAGPSHLALFLGHRLNATAPIQCYERVSTGNYVPTVQLFGTGHQPEPGDNHGTS